MDEIFNKLVESELLNEETKNSLVEAFTAKLNEAVELARAEAVVEVRAELSEQFVNEKALMLEALDSKAEEFLARHLAELNEDISDFRDVEAEFAARLVEERAVMAETLKKDMADLVEKLDQYNTEWMQESFVEFEESINEVKQIQFGKEIFEAVAKTFEKNFSDTNATLNALREAEQKLEEATSQLTEKNKLLENAERDQKLQTVLENLHGRPREIMAEILAKTPTDKLEEGYNKFIGRVLNEGKTEKDSVSTPVLAESKDVTLEEGDVVVTGDAGAVNESKIDTAAPLLSAEMSARLKRMAGIEE